ncbi:MAG: hypothetical protein QF732_08785, partial [Nitrospinaceae bacterium]|nr:hypothetical protein [Nitrospinaceae bacterium]
PDIRKKMIDNEISILFEGKKINNFQHYREYTSTDSEGVDLPRFRYAKTASLLSNSDLSK